MKHLLCVLLISIICYQASFGQSKELLSIPVLKESKSIDSLLDIVLDPNTHPNLGYNSKPLQDSCLYVGSWRAPNAGIHFTFITGSIRQINYIINVWAEKKTLTGYFEYKKVKVFVPGYKNFREFFADAANVADLQFIYRLENTKDGPPDGLIPQGSRQWDFEYKAGRFSRWYIKASY
ncbi:MAG: hypothetical protein JSU01_10380 [Bacteroidetes bacterium]|nr:hypothetical protein [Bacteroidota bacterium]